MKTQNEEKILYWGVEKKHTFNEIKEFYQRVMLFPKEILDQIIFYGGTAAYIVAKSEKVDREFGDVDILVPADKMNFVRKYLEGTGRLDIQYDGKTVAEDYHIVSSDGIQDFGFKGGLFGIKISIHPIAETSDGSLISKWIKTNDDNEVDLIANCVMFNNSSLSEMVGQVDCGIANLNFVKPEITIGWKRRRMAPHDEQDIKFIYDNNKIFGIKEEDINLLTSKMPFYDVSRAYKITPNGINELGQGKYEDF